jgi:hypothetical protein
MVSLQFQYPLFLLLLPLLLWIPFLYRKTRPSPTKWASRILPILRILSTSILILLLANPSFHWRKMEPLRRELVLLVDVSSSMQFLGCQSLVQDWLATMEAPDASVHCFSFAEDLTDHGSMSLPDFSLLMSLQADSLNSHSDYTLALESLEECMGNVSVEAVMLVGDGRANRGRWPLESARDFPWPLYTALAGPLNSPDDAAIQDLLCNTGPFPGQEQVIELTWAYEGEAEFQGLLSLFEEGKLLATKPVQGRGEHSTIFDYTPRGTQGRELKFVLEAQGDFTDSHPQNNTRRVWIQPEDKRKKVLILAGSPCADLGYWQDALHSSVLWESELILDSQLHPWPMSALHEAELFVFLAWPTPRTESRLLQAVLDLAPQKSILLHEQDGTTLARIESLLPQRVPPSRVPRVRNLLPAKMDPVFYPATQLLSLQERWGELPPLDTYHSGLEMSSRSDVLFSSGERSYAFLQRDTPRPFAWLAFSGLRQWQLQSQGLWGQNANLKDFAYHLLQELLSEQTAASFSVLSSSQNVLLGEGFVLSALLRRKPYDQATVQVIATDAAGQVQESLMKQHSKGEFTARIRSNKEGVLEWKALLRQGDLAVLADSGRVFVHAQSAEQRDLCSDAALMREIAQTGGGQAFDLNLESHREELQALRPLRQSSHPSEQWQNKQMDFRGRVWLLVIFILLLVSEWLWRRLEGLL